MFNTISGLYLWNFVVIFITSLSLSKSFLQKSDFKRENSNVKFTILIVNFKQNTRTTRGETWADHGEQKEMSPGVSSQQHQGVSITSAWEGVWAGEGTGTD